MQSMYVCMRTHVADQREWSVCSPQRFRPDSSKVCSQRRIALLLYDNSVHVPSSSPHDTRTAESIDNIQASFPSLMCQKFQRMLSCNYVGTNVDYVCVCMRTHVADQRFWSVCSPQSSNSFVLIAERNAHSGVLLCCFMAIQRMYKAQSVLQRALH